ncbi:MAG: hypothetical protein V4808_12105 [Pseudomonadota bacterium]
MLTSLLFSVAMAFAGQDAPSNTGAAAQDGAIVVEGLQKARNKRVCKRSTSTGSIMTKVTCKTAGEWEIERDRQIAQAERLRMAGIMDSENRRIRFDEPPEAPK